jgi:hypothetical protein
MMSNPKLLAVGGLLLILTGIAAAVFSSQNTLVVTPLPATISGVVTDADGDPVAEAIVQIQGAPTMIETSDDGRFTFTGLGGTDEVIFTAWAPDHYIGWMELDPKETEWQPGEDIHITLEPLPKGDNHEYEWFRHEDEVGSSACGLCHREYDEWLLDAHSQAATNPRFVSIYTGRNVEGELGQPVQWGTDGVPLPPDPDLPFTGPGFLPDNPGGQAGNCAACHAPAAARIPNQQNCAWSGCHSSLTIERAAGLIPWPAMPVAATGTAADGVSCEICHKTSDVIVDPETNLPYPDMPGILSMRLHRPFDDSQQVFFGTLIDVPEPGDTYLPLLSESQFCAACHFGVFGGVTGDRMVTGGVEIYNSYGEWLESPYSDPETGESCQSCHMPESESNWFVFEEQGGRVRDYVTLSNHNMLGITDQEFMEDAVTMESSAQRIGDQIQVQVSIINDNTGHHIPSDSPIRSMILVIEATDSNGQRLELLEGPVNPDFSGDYGGLPGRTFAKVLRDDWTGQAPTAAFWRPVTIIQDNRIAAMETDSSAYTFDAPQSGDATIQVRLIFRRAFYELMQQKGWDDPDLIMKDTTLTVPAN